MKTKIKYSKTEIKEIEFEPATIQIRFTQIKFKGKDLKIHSFIPLKTEAWAIIENGEIRFTSELKSNE